MTTNRALRGLKVLDLSEGVAGPYCTKLLAGLGANVIKVEPLEGDWSRRSGPFPSDCLDPERSALFLHLNTGKHGIVLDYGSRPGLDAVRQLARRSHLLVEGWPPGTLTERGLDPSALWRDNPRLIVTSITPFGQTGPYRSFASSEIVLQALGGYMHILGDPERAPLRLAGWQAHYQAGQQAAIASLGALFLGEGAHVDLSVLESLVFLLHHAPQQYHYTGQVQLRAGQRVGGRIATTHYPVTTLPCQDGYVSLNTDAYHWESLALLFEEPRLLDPRLEAEQHGHADEIDALIQPWLDRRPRDKIVAKAQTLRVPVTAVLDVAELLEDPQHETRGMFVEVEHPVGGRLPQAGAPFKLGASPYATGPAPRLGEHTNEVLSESQRDSPPSGEEWAVPLVNPRVRRPPHEGGPLPLEGVRVADLTHILAGPVATQVLADLGAEVVKVEGTRRWDRSRGRISETQWSSRAWDRNFRFNETNRNKRGMSLDLSQQEGRDLFLRLVRCSDVVIDNFSARVMPNFGFSYRELRELRDDIIAVSMPAFGANGPYRDFVAHGGGGLAMSGLQWLTGYEGGPPQAPGGFYADENCGINAALAVLAALHHRQQTGRGQFIDMAMREAVTPLLGEAILGYAMTGKLPERPGNRDARFAPQGCYACLGEDRWVALTVLTEQEWDALCVLIARADLACDPALRTVAGRQAHHVSIDEAISAWTGQRTAHEAMSQMQAAGLRAGAVQNAADLLANPHLEARSFFQWQTHPVSGPHPHSSLPCLLAGRRPPIRRPAPCYGEDLDYVLEEVLGLLPTQVGDLLARRIVSREPITK